MYLLSVSHDERVVEASLGGRVTVEEMEVLGEELLGMVHEFRGSPHHLLFDYSRARVLDADALQLLGQIKDECLSCGAERIVTIAADEHQVVRHTGLRLQTVLEGKEEFVHDPSLVAFPALTVRDFKVA
jgi:hypothetical protein